MVKLKKPTLIVLKPDDAHKIISWLYGRTSVRATEFTKDDCGFAQALLVEMLNASFAMGFIEALLRSAAKIPSGPKAVMQNFLKGAGKNSLKYKDLDDLKKMMKEPVIYKATQDQVAQMTRSPWNIREASGELTY